jgi:hypothetical protein
MSVVANEFSELFGLRISKVTKTPSWPRSWASFNLV